MKIGGHVSSAGGADKALKRVKDIGGNCLQLFSGSPRTWKLPEVSEDDVEKFKELKDELGIDPVYFHASYLINLADDGRVGHLSKRLLKVELKVAEKLGVKGSVVHVGSFKDRDNESSKDHDDFDVLIDNIEEVLDEAPEDTLFIVENMGTRKIGKNLDEIEEIVNEIDDERIRVCLDTCHLHAAGYDISTENKLDSFLDDFDEIIGLEKLELWHLNDSRDDFESFRDRHANFGEGEIDMKVFDMLLNNSQTKTKPFIIEVPGFDGNGPDKKSINILKDLVK